MVQDPKTLGFLAWGSSSSYGVGVKCYEASHVYVLLSLSCATTEEAQKQLSVADILYVPSI